MSTAVTETKKVESPNGAGRLRRPPIFPMVAAPIAAVSASILVRRLLGGRLARPAKPSVYWSFKFASDNRVLFRPTIAPLLKMPFRRR